MPAGPEEGRFAPHLRPTNAEDPRTARGDRRVSWWHRIWTQSWPSAGIFTFHFSGEVKVSDPSELPRKAPKGPAHLQRTPGDPENIRNIPIPPQFVFQTNVTYIESSWQPWHIMMVMSYLWSVERLKRSKGGIPLSKGCMEKLVTGDTVAI